MVDLKGTKTEKNLEAAFAGESQAHTKYQYFASQASKEGYKQISAIFSETSRNEKEHAKMWIAEEEGFDEIAAKFRLVGQVEAKHEERYRKLAENIENDSVFKRDEEIEWKCDNCGFIYVGEEAPEVCPCCNHPIAYFEERATNY